MLKNKYRALSFTMAGIGWLVSAYLLLRFLSLARNNGLPTTDACSILFGIGCDSTLTNPSVVQLGVPLPGWGLVYFAVVGLLLTHGGFNAVRLAFLLGAGGVGASLAMTGALLIDLSHACPFCIVVHTANFMLFAFLWKTFRTTQTTGRVSVSRSTPGFSTALKCVTTALIIFGLCGQAGFLIYGHRSSGVDFEKVLAEYKATDQVTLPLTPSDPFLGAEKADVSLVVFGSFQCPACRSFSQVTKQLSLDFPEGLQIVFKHYPLSNICNPSVQFDMQPRSCPAAYASQAANLQGKFWPYHDRLFSADLSEEKTDFSQIAQKIGLDLSKFEEDRYSKEVKSVVQEDVDLGNLLGVTAIPSVFINGRRVLIPSYDVLKGLILYEYQNKLKSDTP